MFRLRKWYLDVVDPTGRSAILYWSALRWGPVAVGWHAATAHEPGAAPRHSSSMAAAPEPALCNGTIAWRSDAIDCEVRCLPLQPPVQAELLTRVKPGPDGTGALSWRCEAPAAKTIARVGNTVIEGAGYVERLDLEIPPWQLPIDELRWGRWISDGCDRSIVWIDWRGPEPRTLIHVDARAVSDGQVGDGEVAADGCVLRLNDQRVLHERTLGDLLGSVNSRLPRLPRRWLGLEDRKWLSRAVLAGADGPGREGWAIHERIVFP